MSRMEQKGLEGDQGGKWLLLSSLACLGSPDMVFYLVLLDIVAEIFQEEESRSYRPL